MPAPELSLYFHCDPYQLRLDGIRAEGARLCALPVFGGPEGRLARRPPTIRVEHHQEPQTCMGEARAGQDERLLVVLHVWPGINRATWLSTLLHELVHISDESRWCHYGAFKRALMQGAYEAWGIDVRDCFDGRSPHRDIDHAITRRLWWMLLCDGLWKQLHGLWSGSPIAPGLVLSCHNSGATTLTVGRKP